MLGDKALKIVLKEKSRVEITARMDLWLQVYTCGVSFIGQASF
jgi:hypothetical protein